MADINIESLVSEKIRQRFKGSYYRPYEDSDEALARATRCALERWAEQVAMLAQEKDFEKLSVDVTNG